MSTTFVSLSASSAERAPHQNARASLHARWVRERFSRRLRRSPLSRGKDGWLRRGGRVASGLREGDAQFNCPQHIQRHNACSSPHTFQLVKAITMTNVEVHIHDPLSGTQKKCTPHLPRLPSLGFTQCRPTAMPSANQHVVGIASSHLALCALDEHILLITTPPDKALRDELYRTHPTLPRGSRHHH